MSKYQQQQNQETPRFNWFDCSFTEGTPMSPDTSSTWSSERSEGIPTSPGTFSTWSSEGTPRCFERSEGTPTSPGPSSTRSSEGTPTSPGTWSSKTSQCREVYIRRFDRLQPDRIHYPDDNHGDKNKVPRSSSVRASGPDARSDAQVGLASYARRELKASSKAFQEPIEFDKQGTAATTSLSGKTERALSQLQKRCGLAALVHMILVDAMEHQKAPEPVKMWAGNTLRELAREDIVTARPAEDVELREKCLELVPKKSYYLAALNFLLAQGKKSLHEREKKHRFVFLISAFCKQCDPKFDMDRRTYTKSSIVTVEA